MKIHFTGRNIEVTPALKTFTSEKMERLESRFKTISDVHVTLRIEHLEQIAEATAHVGNSEIHASSKSEDMYHAIDELVDKLMTQIVKHKEKVTGHR